MARALRVEYPGALYHVTSRGNARGVVFQDDRDRTRFLEILADTVEQRQWICHAYCLMDNHYHLLVETPIAGLARGMQRLNGVYTQWFNVRHRRCGHLFQGRYKSVLVDKDSHLLELSRYVVLNPVRSQRVSGPDEWRWSSYMATVGKSERPEFLTVEWILSAFHPDREEAVRVYRDFVYQGCGVRVWEQLRGGVLLGSDEFVERLRPMLRRKPNDPEFRRRERHAARLNLSEIFSGATDRATRDAMIHRAVRQEGYTLREVGEFVGLSYSAISRIAKRFGDGNSKIKV